MGLRIHKSAVYIIIRMYKYILLACFFIIIFFNYSGRFTYFVENLVSSASVLTIIAVTIDRYIAVCKPLHAQSTCTPTRAFKVRKKLFFKDEILLSLLCLINASKNASKEKVNFIFGSVNIREMKLYLKLKVLEPFCEHSFLKV